MSNKEGIIIKPLRLSAAHYKETRAICRGMLLILSTKKALWRA
ncbi:hypothetical protein GAGA_2172 [Paraglaciecola agarilytica NO2]|uniref:Transposase n=1 Tax=Paraglaciecola agarilytica NO2 TaxID=1125747 RepID=A0ABQ0I6P3_9ALTE|nr:hypothetical protein GAGA_2172 [Paraglaciecola agarilytica NO2]